MITKILELSTRIDHKYNENISNFKVDFSVPKTHKRYSVIKKYSITEKRLTDLNASDFFFIVDTNVAKIPFVKDCLHDALILKSEEKENGSMSILRAGHTFSDRLEEESQFSSPHGLAVAMGILKELNGKPDKKRALALFEKYGVLEMVKQYV